MAVVDSNEPLKLHPFPQKKKKKRKATSQYNKNMTLIDGIYFFLKQLLFAMAQVNWESKKPDSDGNFYDKRRN